MTWPNLNRRLFRFSLRAMLVVMVPVAMVFGWAHSAYRQKTAVERLRANLAVVYYAHEVDARGEVDVNAVIDWDPSWLEELVDIDFIYPVVRVGSDTATDADLLLVASLSSTRVLRCGVGSRVSDEGLKLIRNLMKLEELVLHSSFVTDEGLKQIAGVQTLKRVYLGTPQVTDDGIAALGRLSNLEELGFDGCPNLTSAALLNVRAINGLKRLRLNGCHSMTLDHIGFFTEIEELDIFLWDRFTDADVAQLTKLPALRHLYLNCREGTDDGLATVAKLHNLEVLELYFWPKVTEEGVRHLGALTNLRSLTLSLDNSKGVGKSAIERLQRDLPYCDIVIRN